MGRTFFASADYAAVEEADYAVGFHGLGLVVGYHDDCGAVLGVEAVEEAHHLGAHLAVEVAGGLVGEDNLGLTYDGTGYGHALSLTAAELRGQMVDAVGHLEALKHLRHTLLALVGADALAVNQR